MGILLRILFRFRSCKVYHSERVTPIIKISGGIRVTSRNSDFAKVVEFVFASASAMRDIPAHNK